MLRVYRYLYRIGRPAGIHDIQRGLGLSSSSVAQYHVKKLLAAGLIREAPPESSDQQGEAGGYVVDRVIFENMIRIRRSLIPLQVGYSVFFATALAVLLVLLRPKVIGGAYVFSLFAIAVACSIFGYQAFKALKNTAI